MSTTSRPVCAGPLRCGLLLLFLFASPPAVRAQEAEEAQEAGYRLPLVLGPHATPWKLLAGTLTRDAARLELRAGTQLVVSDYRFGDCVWEMDYCTLGPQPVEPVFYFRADAAPGGAAVCGPAVRLRQPAAAARARWRRTSRGQATCPTWHHLRIELCGNCATATVNGTRVSSITCGGRPDGLLAIGVAGDSQSSLAVSHMQVTETGYASLFSGSDLSGWEGADADAARCWRAADGLLECTGQAGPWLRSRVQYSDFRLRLEYRVQAGGNSGVYVRVPRDGNHHGPGAGIEVQILDDGAPRYSDLKPYQFTASLYAIAPAAHGTARPPGMWNSLEICCVGHHYTITHNGQVVLDATEHTCPALAERLTRGFVGLQNHSEAVWFRHLRIASP